jgi:diguanylate cyclase
MRSTSGLVLGFDVAALVAAGALITVAGLALSRSQRKLRTQSALNRHQALHDSLTGLPNRSLFQDRTAHALRAAQRPGSQIAVMLADLNRFKDVNDTLGHQYGDLLLCQVAQRFSATVRGADSVARLGGDEFAVLLSDSDPDAAVAAAKRLTDVLHEPFTVKDISLDVEASIGIAVSDADTDVETALRHADVAMYQAKSQHLPYATYERTHDGNTIARLALLGDLRRAIKAGELFLHYQPKVTTSTGELHSVEALVRWQHPTRGLLAPGQFIPVAESTAVIHPLTTEILRQALSQVRAWLNRGWTIPVAVNISARSLLDCSFPAQVHRQLEASGVPASLLSLELTESAIMTDPARALEVLRSLNALGVGLSIDDFGTGYSSMAYVKDLPVHELKIDRSFVMGMASLGSDVVLVQSAVDLGHNLGLHVVAEGVEDAATQQALTAMGCDLLQGYHIRRPVSAADLDPWLRAHLPAGLQRAAAVRL